MGSLAALQLLMAASALAAGVDPTHANSVAHYETSNTIVESSFSSEVAPVHQERRLQSSDGNLQKVISNFVAAVQRFFLYLGAAYIIQYFIQQSIMPPPPAPPPPPSPAPSPPVAIDYTQHVLFLANDNYIKCFGGITVLRAGISIRCHYPLFNQLTYSTNRMSNKYLGLHSTINSNLLFDYLQEVGDAVGFSGSYQVTADTEDATFSDMWYQKGDDTTGCYALDSSSSSGYGRSVLPCRIRGPGTNGDNGNIFNEYCYTSSGELKYWYSGDCIGSYYTVPQVGYGSSVLSSFTLFNFD